LVTTQFAKLRKKETAPERKYIHIYIPTQRTRIRVEKEWDYAREKDEWQCSNIGDCLVDVASIK